MSNQGEKSKQLPQRVLCGLRLSCFGVLWATCPVGGWRSRSANGAEMIGSSFGGTRVEAEAAGVGLGGRAQEHVAGALGREPRRVSAAGETRCFWRERGTKELRVPGAQGRQSSSKSMWPVHWMLPTGNGRELRLRTETTTGRGHLTWGSGHAGPTAWGGEEPGCWVLKRGCG